MGFFNGLDQDKYDRQYSDNYLYARMWSYFSHHKKVVAWIVVISLLSSILVALIPVMFSLGVDLLDDPDAGQLLLLLVLGQVAMAFIYFGFFWGQRSLTARIVARVVATLRQDALAAAVARDMAFYDENKSGKVLSRITADTEEFGQVVGFASRFFTEIGQAVILAGILFSINVRLTLISFAFFPMIFLVATGMRHLARIVTRQGARMMAVVNDTIQETVSGIGVAKNFRREALVYDEFVEVNTQSYQVNLKRGAVLAAVFPVLNGISGFAIGGMLYFGGQSAVLGVISIGAWYLFMQAMNAFWFPILNLSAFWSQFQAGMSAIERVFSLIDTENTVVQTGDEIAPRLKGALEFDEVTFGYSADLPILQDFNLKIGAGENVAFVGHTGAGKSSIVKLLTRFYEFQDGTIRADGHDVRGFNLQSYRSQLGLVPQSPFLFSGTIMDNIRYGRPEISDEEIETVARSIGEGAWVDTLPDGLNSDVGERGGRLSMGQRQLVSLCRVLAQKPAVFILDEATASIDPFTEAQIQEALDLIFEQSTSIIIAHRLSTVRSADRIIVLRDGQIIEQGDHDSLIAQGGHYAELYNTYFRHQSLNYIENARALFDEEAAK